MEVYEIQKLQLSSSWDRTALTALLQSQGLRLDGDVETAFGVYETSGEEPKLVGCGCAAGRCWYRCFRSSSYRRWRQAAGPGSGWALCSGLRRGSWASGQRGGA